MHFYEVLHHYWLFAHASAQISVVTAMLVALFLGFTFGYERSYRGRAAGVRTYGLVCMVSAALTALSAHPDAWSTTGQAASHLTMIDPTRTIQGIVTGIGFLGAGIIMQNGMKISGLTTAASIWCAAAIGVLVGLGFYIPALSMTIVALLFVLFGASLDRFLPAQRPISVRVQFKRGFHPTRDYIVEMLKNHGYRVARGSLSIQHHNNQLEWRFVALSNYHRRDLVLSDLAHLLPSLEGVDSFFVSRARN